MAGNDRLRRAFDVVAGPVCARLVQAGVSPNLLTSIGCGLSLAASGLLAVGHPTASFGLLFLGGVADAVDGKVARDSGKVTRFGAFLDSSLDRVSEIALTIGAAAYFNRLGRLDSVLVMWMLTGLGTILMISYLRARAEALGFAGDVGWLQRPQRGFLFAAGILSGPVGLYAAIVAITVLGGITILQRFLHIYRQSVKSP